MNNHNIAQALTIAGSDSGGGAGIQADLKTFQMRGVFGTSVITAVTAQNTLGVYDIHPIPLTTIEAQLKAIAEDFQISVFKLGMLGTAEIIECVSHALAKCRFGQMVLDPVMIAKGGAPLLQQSAVTALKQYLVPLAEIITPNLPEAEALTGIRIIDDRTVEQAARYLQQLGAKTVVIKGGHSGNSQSAVCRDWIFSEKQAFTLESPRYPTQHTHGTGCTLSSAIASYLAQNNDLLTAVGHAKHYITQAIIHSQNLHVGQGHGPVDHFFALH